MNETETDRQTENSPHSSSSNSIKSATRRPATQCRLRQRRTNKQAFPFHGFVTRCLVPDFNGLQSLSLSVTHSQTDTVRVAYSSLPLTTKTNRQTHPAFSKLLFLSSDKNPQVGKTLISKCTRTYARHSISAARVLNKPSSLFRTGPPCSFRHNERENIA